MFDEWRSSSSCLELMEQSFYCLMRKLPEVKYKYCCHILDYAEYEEYSPSSTFLTWDETLLGQNSVAIIKGAKKLFTIDIGGTNYTIREETYDILIRNMQEYGGEDHV
eukprot:snap_masked-scaffold_3-processed-gene-10.23-mRNA-1 protein AED:1.00 eAED:1.00 QI:0/0/0/0/1/1/2/0/107